jgi:hypothetical protein
VRASIAIVSLAAWLFGFVTVFPSSHFRFGNPSWLRSRDRKVYAGRPEPRPEQANCRYSWPRKSLSSRTTS